MNAVSIGRLQRDAEDALRDSRYRDAHACCIEILRREPGHADAIFLLGMIALAHGQVRKAVELIDRALAANGDNAEYLAQRARCLVLLKEDSAALTTARRALTLRPESALTLDTLGVALSKAGDHEAAIDAFERAVAKAPDNAQYRFNLAASQNFMGRFDDAAATFERAIALQPDFFRAHWALSEQTRATAERNHVERLARLLERPGLDADAELYLCHALAKEHEDLGDYAAAFEYWRRGKAARSAAPDFSVDDYAAIFESIENVCSAEFVAAAAPGHDSTEPIFVVGMPRTGTTLVERILASHEDVFPAGELSEFGICLKQAAGTTSNRVLDAETVQRARDLDFAAVGRKYIESTRPRTGHTRHFVDKLPPNFLYAGFIRRALPKAKIVCLRRNPLDTCLSNYRQLFSINAPYYNYAYDLLDVGRYYVSFDRLIEHWTRVLGEAFLVVRYEDIVEDQERESRRLLEFCGLTWTPDVLDFHRLDVPVATASFAQVRRPVYSTSVRRWTRYESALAPLRALLEAHGIDCG